MLASIALNFEVVHDGTSHRKALTGQLTFVCVGEREGGGGGVIFLRMG